eukprot:CAMPEP_0116875278 /NCGR_PEP_ID=MMETSP0463-20121206/7152_1 /TAXON_ID=181622 /ORGANISM="Strombidinopsis sp, Strain SopsisLIS2011" /LENGTH=46 /DNA_ID= /DNA_START= /DNA_END= /DNA_ORIENTATION=
MYPAETGMEGFKYGNVGTWAQINDLEQRKKENITALYKVLDDPIAR